MAQMTDRELRAIVDAEFSTAMGAPDGQISTDRAKAWDYYLSKELGNEVEGQSSVVMSDVSDVVDGVMPSLLRIFTTADNVVEFEPVGPEDEPQARQESDYVNHVFFKQNPAFEIMYTWFFDALVQKNGIVKAWWDDSEEITSESYRGLTDQELAELLDDDELEAVERDEREIEIMTEAVVAPGQVIGVPQKVTVHDVKFKRTSKRGQVRIEPVPPEEYRISSDSNSIDPCKARMVGHEREITRSDLIDMGFDADIVENLPSTSQVHESPEELSRRNKTDDDAGGPHDPSQEMVLVREAYIRVDYDGDGRSELRQVFTAGDELLSNEEADRQPFHVICPQPLPHKHFGRATAEKVMDVQKVNTTLVRQILDNLYHTNQPGHAVWEQGIGDHTLDDLLTTATGRVARFSRPVGESYAPMTVPFTAGATFPMLEFWDKVKRDRTGVAADGEGLDPEQLKNIQSSVLAQASDLSRMKVEAVARIFAETGVKSLFRHIHELLLKHQDKLAIVQLRNQWVEVDPREWRTRQNMTVKIGLGIGTREANLIHLNAIWDKQRQIVEAGGFGSLVSPMNIFNTAAEIVKNANLQNPEMFFTPIEEIPQQDGEAELARAQLELAERQQALDAQEQALDREKTMLQHQREVEKINIDREKAESDMMVKMEEIANKITEMELKFNENVPGSRV